MVAGCGANCMKYTLFLFNLLFFLAGLGLVGIGAVIMVLMDSVVQDLKKDNPDMDVGKILTVVAIVFMVTGFILMGICFFGCCGAIKEIKCLLGTYAVLIGIVIIGELAVVIPMFVYRGQLEGLAEDFNDLMRDNVRKYSGEEESAATMFVDSIQKTQKCCGADSWEDFKTKAKGWKDRNQYVVPISCCRLDDEGGDLNKKNLAFSKCPEQPTQLNSHIGKSCLNKPIFIGILNTVFMIVVGTIFGLIAIELVGIIFAVCLIRLIGEPRAVPV